MEILLKAERFCAYQERCSHEVEQKLKEWKTSPSETKKIIDSLKEDGYLDDQRFARLFVSGKFRIKKWGLIRIRMELRKRKISESMIRLALEPLEKEQYSETIRNLIIKKNKQLSGQPASKRKEKIFRFVASKGFEPGKILDELKKIRMVNE